jgi:hypothetical protein
MSRNWVGRKAVGLVDQEALRSNVRGCIEGAEWEDCEAKGRTQREEGIEKERGQMRNGR